MLQKYLFVYSFFSFRMLSRDETSMIIFKSIDRMKEVSKMEQNNPWAVIGKLNL